MSVQSQYGAVETETPVAATPRRGRAVVLALALCAGGALLAVAGPAKSPRLRGTRLDSYWTIIGGTPTQVEPDAEGLEVVIATMVDGERVPVDSPPIVGGPGDDDHDCCGGGSACGWGWCEAQGKCTQVWECDDPPAASSTPTDPGVVNYFPTVAKQANTDCGGGESVGVNCAGGTPLSTEDKISGEGETVGDVPVSSATTVEGANTGTATTVKCPTECPLMLRRLQACPPPQEGYQYGEAPKDECGCTTGCPPIVKASATTTPIINTAGGTSSQSGCTGSDCIITTGSAASRGTTGAGNAKYIPGRK